MAETTGFIVVVNEPERADRLTETIAEFGRFSDAFSAPDWRAKRAELVLVSLDGNTVMAVGLAMRRQFVATQKYRIDFTNLVLIEPPLAIAELENALSPRLRSHFVRSASGGGGRIPPATWQQVWTGLGQRRPDLLPDLRRLEQLSADAPIRWYEAPSTLAEEKDTVAVALRIAGFRPDEVQAWSPRTRQLPI